MDTRFVFGQILSIFTRKKMKKKVAPAKVMFDLNDAHPSEYRKYSRINMAIYDFTRQIWKFLRAITFTGAHFFIFFFAEYS